MQDWGLNNGLQVRNMTKKERYEFTKEPTITAREVPRKQLSSECWTVQFEGLFACKRCKYKKSRECGGKNIRKTGKNAYGYKVPLGVK